MKLQAIRQQLGLTQEQLAVKAGVSDTLISKIERDRSVTQESLDKVVTALVALGMTDVQIEVNVSPPLAQRVNRHFSGNAGTYYQRAKEMKRIGN